MRRSQLFGGGGAAGRNGGGGGPGGGGNEEDAKACGMAPDAGPAPIGWLEADMKSPRGLRGCATSTRRLTK